MRAFGSAAVVSAAILAFVVGAAFSSLVFPSGGATTVTMTVTRPSSSSRLYQVMFNQTGACSPPFYLAPWSVTLGNETAIFGPANATLPLSDSHYEAAQQFKAYAVIVFSVPNGTYTYSVQPQFLAQKGTVTVNGADLVVQVRAPPVTCRTMAAGA